MRSKGFVILAVVTAASVAAAAWAVIEREKRTSAAAAPAALFPGLIDRVNDVDSVAVRGPGIEFTIVRGEDGGWSVPEKGGYPVPFETVKQAVVGIAALKPLEPRTAKPELHAKLNLRAPENNGRGTLLALRDGGGQDLAAVIVGKTRSVATSARPGWHYVRKADENQSWLAEGRVEVWDKIDRWLDSEMPIVERRRVHIVRTVKPGGEVIAIAKEDPDARDFTVRDIPDGMRKLHTTSANSLGSAFGFLTFEDVVPADQKPLDDPLLVQVKTFEGLVVELHVVKTDDDAYWCRFSGRFDPESVAMDGLSEGKRHGMKTEDEVREEADRINARFGGWVYKLPEYKGKDFFITRDELIMKIPEGEKTGG